MCVIYIVYDDDDDDDIVRNVYADNYVPSSSCLGSKEATDSRDDRGRTSEKWWSTNKG